jgi:glutamate--cysteine ligase
MPKNQNSARFQKLLDSGQQHLLQGGLKGIEKESLRISKNGFISQTPHPASLGAALTHPHITTDYSEALLEFITPPHAEIEQSLSFLHQIHQFVYAQLNDELLLSASMPCGINGDESIPIAMYGNSNVGKMKHIYRQGLAHRYGRTMQAIAGIHFNYSVPIQLWPVLQALEKNQQSPDEFIAQAYFDLTRNFQRLSWLILYLFGASPAICKNFFKSRPELINQFEHFDAHTIYHPYATSLRMSDIGYKSKNQENLHIDFNSLQGYVSSLIQAIETPDPAFEKIGVKVDGQYRQLNSNILQIENEYYNTIRPKQIANSCEKPTLALKRRGVQYIEVRSLDLDLFNPIGIDTSRACFIEALLLTCLLLDSPASTDQDHRINNENQLLVAHQGRMPELLLTKGNSKILLQDWADEILEYMQPVCAILDQNTPFQRYSEALQEQRQCVMDANLTPSAKILAGMQQQQQPFAPFALAISSQHEAYFRSHPPTPEQISTFRQLASQSHLKQSEVEAYDQLNFDEFLQCYFDQTCEYSDC